MNILLELVFRGIIVRFLGINTRYLFFKILGNEKSKKELSGDTKGEIEQIFNQGFINAIVGLAMLCLIFFIGGYLLFKICPDCI